jgi:hypothetical protein
VLDLSQFLLQAISVGLAVYRNENAEEFAHINILSEKMINKFSVGMLVSEVNNGRRIREISSENQVLLGRVSELKKELKGLKQKFLDQSQLQAESNRMLLQIEMDLNGKMEMRRIKNEVVRKVEEENQIKLEMKLQEICDMEKGILSEELLVAEKLHSEKESLSDQMKEIEYKITDFIRKARKTNDEEVELVLGVLKGNDEAKKRNVMKEDGETQLKKPGRNPPSSSLDDDGSGLFGEDGSSRIKSRKLIAPQEQVRSEITGKMLIGWLKCYKDGAEFEAVMLNHGFKFTTYGNMRFGDSYDIVEVMLK